MGFSATVKSFMRIEGSCRVFFVWSAANIWFYEVLDFSSFTTELWSRFFNFSKFLPFFLLLLDFLNFQINLSFVSFKFSICHIFQIFLFISMWSHFENFVLDIAHFCKLRYNIRISMLKPITFFFKLSILIFEHLILLSKLSWSLLTVISHQIKLTKLFLSFLEKVGKAMRCLFSALNKHISGIFESYGLLPLFLLGVHNFCEIRPITMFL